MKIAVSAYLIVLCYTICLMIFVLKTLYRVKQLTNNVEGYLELVKPIQFYWGFGQKLNEHFKLTSVIY